MIVNMATVPGPGQMADSMQATGKKVNNMVKEYSRRLMEENALVFGMKG